MLLLMIDNLFFICYYPGNMNEQLLRQLEDMGLSEKEAKVYVASLMLGPATVQQIANQADIKRVTTYVILESLSSLGLVGQASHGKKTFFTAEEPVSLQGLLDKKERQIAEQKEAFKAFLPDLESLKSIPPETPTVKYYDTVEGIHSIVGSFLLTAVSNKTESIYGFSDVDKVEQFFPQIAKRKGNPARIQAGMHSKLIYTSERGPIYKQYDNENIRESRHIPGDKYPIKGDLTLAGDSTLFLSLDGDHPFGVSIKSAAVAAVMKTLFDMAWAEAEKYND
jgi:sugar-specific transcriptional regulator TrmB